jgi:hypothetical protein
MNHPLRTIRVLVAVHVVLHVIALWVMMIPGSGPSGRLFDLVLFPLFTLGPSQGTLLALWAVLGGGRFVWRSVPTLLGTIVYLWYFKSANREWLDTTFGELGGWFAILLVGRLAGLQLARTADARHDPRRRQFSIRDMLVWMVAVAVLLSALRCLPLNARMPRTIFAGVLFTSLSLVGGASMFSLLGQGWLLARVLALPGAVAVGAVLLSRFPGAHSGWHFAMLLALIGGWLAGSLLCVRRAGYRLTWQWRFSRKKRDVPGGPDRTEAASVSA